MRIISSVAACAWLVFSGSEGFAQTANVEAPAAIQNPLAEAGERRPINVRQMSPIEFGTFASAPGGGGVLIDAASGARRPVGGVSLLNAGSYGPAEFEISGQPGEIVIVYLPNQIQLSSSGASMPVTQLQVVPPGEITLDQSGRARVRVGGVLAVAGNVVPGAYNGYFDIDVRYLK